MGRTPTCLPRLGGQRRELIAIAHRVAAPAGYHLCAKSSATVTNKGRATIPVDVRTKLGLRLDQLRAVAAERGTSLQSYLRDAVHAQAVCLRRQAAIADTSERLRGQAEVPDSERDSVMVAVERAHQERTDQLSGRPGG